MRQCVLEGGQGTQKEGRGVWAKQDLLELDAPLRRRLGAILGYERWGGGKSRWRPCGWRLEFLLAGPATLDRSGTLLLLLLIALA